MSIRLRLICVFVLGVLASAAEAQMKSVTVDLNTGAFSAGVPFDETFRLIGPADNLAQRVELVFGKLDREQCGKQQQPRGICAGPPTFIDPVGPLVWTRTSPGTASFAFTIPPLEPNTCYGFHIKQQLLPLGEDDRKKVREALSKEFRKNVTDRFKDGTLTKGELTKIQNELQNSAETTVKSQFLACIPADAVDLSNPVAVAARDKILKASDTFEINDTKNIPNRQKEILRALCLIKPCVPSTEAWAKGLSSELASLLADPSILAPGALLAWNAPLNPAREPHKTTTMSQVARALAASTEVTRRGLIMGALKFAGPNLENASEPDAQSIALLADFLDVYTSDMFRKKSGNTTEPVVTAAVASEVSAQAPVRDLADLMIEKATAKQTFDTTLLPDILANLVLDRGFDLTASPTVITEGKNPYIGVDAGMGYAFNLDKPYVYVGANFYRVPINKDQKGVPYWGVEGLNKRVSLLLGLATSIDGAKNLVGPGTPMAGLGYRFSRYVKLSTGSIVFKQKDENPLIDKDHVKLEPFVSISIDTDLKALLGGVGKLFGL